MASPVHPGTRFASKSEMLTLCDTVVPQTDVAYIAFRIAFQETLERIRSGRPQIAVLGI